MSNATLTRRNFLMVAGAAAAACAATGCSNLEQTDMAATGGGDAPAEEEEPVELVHTSCRACISNCGVIAHVRGGRVVKIEEMCIRDRCSPSGVV